MAMLGPGLLGVSIVLFLMGMGLPVAIALMSGGFIGIVLTFGLDQALAVLGIFPITTLWSSILAGVPLFILLGSFVFYSGLGYDVYKTTFNWLGHLRGGLAIATIFGCALFAAVSGSSVATSVTMGKIAIPEMRRYKYSDSFSGGVAASGGLLGIMIPPSIPFVIYGVITGEPIDQLLIAGIVPGILTALLFMVMIYFRAWLQPDLAPRGDTVPWKIRIASLLNIWPVILLFIVVMGGIYAGIFTPTEAAAAGAFIAFLYTLYRGGERFGNIKKANQEAAVSSGMILIIFVGASIFTAFISLLGIPSWVVRTFSALPFSPVLTLLVVLSFYIPLGMFLDPISIMIITLPIVHPIVKSLGFSGVWFGVIIVKFIEVSDLTPPIGFNVFAIKGIFPEIPLTTLFKGITWFLATEFITLAILIAFPDISLWLPQMMQKLK